MDKKKIIIVGLIIVVFILITGITLAINMNNQTQLNNNTTGINNTTQVNTATVENVVSDNAETQSESSSSQENDPGACYNEQAGRTIYTGEIFEDESGYKIRHLGNNEWESLGWV